MMNRIQRWSLRRGLGRDRGGIAVLVCVFLASGVLLGTSAIVVDVGAIYAERGQLQNGADAAARALAAQCARTPATCASTALGRAAGLGNGNARDGAATVALVCGRGVTPALPACTPGPTNRAACVTPTPATGSFVEVRTSTRTIDNNTLLPPSLARGLVGKQDYEGVNIRSCARASWGAPRSTTGLAFTTSLCEWSEATAGGTTFAPAPPTVPSAAYEVAVYTKDGPNHTCPGVSGHNAPGNFGWLDDTGGCTATITHAGNVGGNPGASGHNCDAALAAAATARTSVPLPIYDTVSGNGSHTSYHMVGVAAFVITGYSLPGSSRASWLTGRTDCDQGKGKSDRCLLGYYTRAIVMNGGAVAENAPDLGASSVALSG